MKNLINEWNNRSEECINQRHDILTTLKHSQPSNIDQIAQECDQNIRHQIDCLKCGNCCRTSVTDFNSSDIKRASKFLGISRKQFIKKYLIEDFGGEFVTISAPCPFLNLDDNTCSIYEVRPFVCQSFPHTQRDSFLQRIHAHKANVNMCPITYHVVEAIAQKMNL